MSLKGLNESVAHFLLYVVMFSSLVNSQFQFVFGFEVYRVLPVLLLYLLIDSFFCLVCVRKVRISGDGFILTVVTLFLVFYLFIFALYNSNGRVDYVFSIAIALIVSLLSWRVFTNPVKAAKVSVLFFSVIVFLTLVDVNGLIKSFVTSTRGALNAGPLSISLLCSLLIAGALFVVKNGYLKFTLIVIACGLAVITLSRGPVLSLLLSLGIYISLRNKAYLLLLPMIVVLLSPFIVLFAQYRAGSIFDRLNSYNHVLNSLSENPLGGLGVGYYDKVYGVYAHNSLLQWWLELGLPVSLVLVFLISLLSFSNLTYPRCSRIDARGYFAVLMLVCFVSSQLSFDPIRVFIYLFPLIIINIYFFGLKWR